MNPSESIQIQQLLKATDVAKILNISRALAYRLMQKGDIPVVRIKHAVRVKLTDLESYIESCRVGDRNE